MRVVCWAWVVALEIADHEDAVFLIEVGEEEILEEAAQDIEILWALFVGNPTVAQGLEDQGNAVHLPIGTDAAAKGPARPSARTMSGRSLIYFSADGAQARQLAFAQVDVAVAVAATGG